MTDLKASILELRAVVLRRIAVRGGLDTRSLTTELLVAKTDRAAFDELKSTWMRILLSWRHGKS